MSIVGDLVADAKRIILGRHLVFQRMRTKGIFIAIALVGFVASALADGGGYMKADEVTALMSGNSISGMFGDNKAYRQRNHSNGIAVVAFSLRKISRFFVDCIHK